MQPTCAACMQPVVAGRFVIARTEVMHKRCAAAGMQTQLQKAVQVAADAAAVTANAVRTANEATNELVELRARRVELLARVRDTAESERAARGDAQQQRALVAARDAVIADLRRQLAEARTTNNPVVDDAAPKYGDDAVARFSLLELD